MQTEPSLSENNAAIRIEIPSWGDGTNLTGTYVLGSQVGPRLWDAHDEISGKPVSLRFLFSAEELPGKFLPELRSEIKRARQFAHPGAVRTQELVEEFPAYAVVTDPAPPRSAVDLIAESQHGYLEPAAIIGWLRTVGDTLDDAHRLGLYHRNLHPMHLLMPDDRYTVLLYGFGFAWAVADFLERSGVGEVEDWNQAALSPQMLDGDRPCKEDDIYGFGALIYRLLTGEPVFTGENTVTKIRRETPARMSDIRVAKNVAAVPLPESWERSISAALSKDPTQRPASAAELVARLTGASGTSSGQTTKVGFGSALKGATAVAAAGQIFRGLASSKEVAPKAVGVEGPVQSIGATEVSATIADDVNAEVAEATVASPEPLPQSSENGGAASAEGLDAPASVDASEGGNRAFASSDEDGSTQEFSRFARDAAAAGAVSVATNRFWPPSGTPDALSFASRSEKLVTQNAGGAVEGPQTESSLNSPFWRRSKAPVVPSDDALEARFEHDTPPAIGVDNESGGNFLEDVETTSQETDIMEDYQQRREGISRMAVAGLGVAAVLGGLGVLWATGFGSKKDPGKGLGDSVVQLDLQPGTGSEPAGGTGAGPSENPAAVTTSPDGTAGTEVPSDSGVNSRTSGTIGVSSSSPPVGATQTDVGTGVPTNAPHGDGAITAKVPETTSVLPAVRDLPKPTQGSQTSASSNSAAPGMDPLRVVDDSDLRALEKVPAVPPIPQGAQSLAKEELERLAALRTEALQSVRANATQVYRLAEEAIKARDAAANQLKSIEGTIEAVRQVCEPVIKQSAQTEQRLRQKQDELRRAEAAAIDAQRAAEAAKQSLSAVERSASEVLAKKAQADEQLKKVSDQISRIAGEREAYSQRFTKLTALRDQYDIKIREIDSQNRTLAGFVDKVRRAEMEKKRQANAGKIRELMDRAEPLKTKLKTLDDAIKKVETVSPDLAKTMRESYDREKAQLDGLLKEVAELNGGVPSDELALPESRGQQPTLSESGGKPVINGLKMRLVPVGDVYFSVYPTRVRDFEAFATERRLASSGWKNPGFKQTGDHPVVNVTWKEANGFCIWLTEKERKAGRIKGDQAYRLPTDLEWSMAVGLSAEEGATPAARDMGVDTQFPWGTQWPPPPKTANLSGEEMESSHAIAGYNDGYPNTSPVGMFGANEYGLYDMAGNVAQWTMDSWTPESPERVIRGSSWMQALRVAVLSSSRGKYKPDVGLDTVGFRVVLAPVQ